MRFVRTCLFPNNGKQRNLLVELNVFRSEKELRVFGENKRPSDSSLYLSPLNRRLNNSHSNFPIHNFIGLKKTTSYRGLPELQQSLQITCRLLNRTGCKTRGHGLSKRRQYKNRRSKKHMIKNGYEILGLDIFNRGKRKINQNDELHLTR